jgi:aquaporin Z
MPSRPNAERRIRADDRTSEPDRSPGASQRQRMLHETRPPDFLDASLEWRRMFSELWRTFLLVVVAAGANVVAARSNGEVTPGMAVVAPGMMVMAIIYFMGTVSGAHLKPAVTLAFAMRRTIAAQGEVEESRSTREGR